MNAMLNANLRRDVAAALARHKYELVGDGRILVPAAKTYIGGVFTSDVNGHGRQVDPNLLVSQGLIDILSVYFKNATQRTAFYIAPFSGNVTPTAALTGANFTATQSEFTNYSQSSRVQWTPPGGAIMSPSLDNSASVATFNVSADNQNVYGFGLITSAPKGDVTGTLVACALLGAARTGLMTGDTLNVTYGFSATSA